MRIFWRRKRDSKCPVENIVVSVARRCSLLILLIFALVPLPYSATGGGRVPSPRRQAVARVRIFRLFSATKKGHRTVSFFCGGEREIRTLAPVSRPTPLAGEPLHHLGTSPCIQFSRRNYLAERVGFEPTALSSHRFSRPAP